jgi:hypothetical protein
MDLVFNICQAQAQLFPLGLQALADPLELPVCLIGDRFLRMIFRCSLLRGGFREGFLLGAVFPGWNFLGGIF